MFGLPRMLCRALQLAAAVSIGATAASASPVLWTLQDFTFADGATAQGSFVFDDDMDVFSAIAITTSGGIFPAAAYTVPSQYNAPPQLEFGDVSPLVADSVLINFIITAPLTNAGGVVPVLPALPNVFGGLYGICTDDTCSAGNNANLLADASLIGTAVPEPASLGLLCFGLAGLAARRRVGRA